MDSDQLVELSSNDTWLERLFTPFINELSRHLIRAHEFHMIDGELIPTGEIAIRPQKLDIRVDMQANATYYRALFFCCDTRHEVTFTILYQTVTICMPTGYRHDSAFLDTRFIPLQPCTLCNGAPSEYTPIDNDDTIDEYLPINARQYQFTGVSEFGTPEDHDTHHIRAIHKTWQKHKQVCARVKFDIANQDHKWYKKLYCIRSRRLRDAAFLTFLTICVKKLIANVPPRDILKMIREFCNHAPQDPIHQSNFEEHDYGNISNCEFMQPYTIHITDTNNNSIRTVTNAPIFVDSSDDICEDN